MTADERTRKKTAAVKLVNEVRGSETQWRMSRDGGRTAVTEDDDGRTDGAEDEQTEQTD